MSPHRVFTPFDAHPMNLAPLPLGVRVSRGEPMTERLYYDDSFLYEFDGQVMEVVPVSEGEARPAVILDRTAFYPTSGGQVFDTGWIAQAAASVDGVRCAVVEVADREDGA